MKATKRGQIAIVEWAQVAFTLSVNRKEESRAALGACPLRDRHGYSSLVSPRLRFQQMVRRSCRIATIRLRQIVLLFLFTELASAVTLPPLWRWSNPTPHGANVVDQAANSDLIVQIGERGQIFLSDDWSLWTPRDSYTTAALRGATFFGGRLVITGEAGTVMFADDPWNFHGLTLGTADWLESVAASSNVLVAVGDNAAIFTSTNAVNWKRVTPPFSNWLRGVACNGSTFVAVGEGGLIASSPNGSAWQVRNSGTESNLNRVAWLGDHFLAVGDGGTALSSINGSQWLPVDCGASNNLYAATGVTNSHLAAGDAEVRLSEDNGAWSDQLAPALSAPAPVWTYYSALSDGSYQLIAGRSGMTVAGGRTNSAGPVVWQPLADSVRSWLWSVARTPTHYVAVGDYGTILSSPNGIDWDLELIPLSVTNSILLGVGGSSNLLLAVGTQGTVLWGTNVFLWNEVLPRPTTNDLQGVCHDGAQFILTGGNGTILTSPNAVDWTRRPTPTSAFLMSVASFPNGLVVVGEDGIILTSNDGGMNWTTAISGTTNWLSQVRWLNDRLLAVGENGCILSSTDGLDWRIQGGGTTAWLNAADFIEDTWFVAGNQGTVLGSPDCTNWFSFGALTRKSLYGLANHAGQLITVGSEGSVLRCQLVPDSTPIRLANFNRASGMNVFLFTGAPDQQFRLQSSDDLVGWSDGALLEFLDSSGTLTYVEEDGTNGPPAHFYRALRTR